ncbi:hypothetical protein [Amphritea sp.]|uniref:hypothetical protein n=1 Tax=Amphritea sp. TaxID=1872502 RepID=UPI003D0E9CC9
MQGAMTPIKEIQLEQMTQLRERSKAVSVILNKELQAYLKTITPLFSPRKVLGEYMQSASRDKVVGAEKNYSIILENYKSVLRDAFGYNAKLSSPVPAIQNELVAEPWVYRDDLDGTILSFSSPVRWVLSYDCSYDLPRLIAEKLKDEQPHYDSITSFVLNALVIWLLLENSPGLVRLLEGLGYAVSIERQPKIAGMLPFVVLTSRVAAFRPQNELVRMVSQFSGSTGFEEIIDVDQIDAIENPLQIKLQSLLNIEY